MFYLQLQKNCTFIIKYLLLGWDWVTSHRIFTFSVDRQIGCCWQGFIQIIWLNINQLCGPQASIWACMSTKRHWPALTVTALTNCSLQLLLPTTSARLVFFISLSTVFCKNTQIHIQHQEDQSNLNSQKCVLVVDKI